VSTEEQSSLEELSDLQLLPTEITAARATMPLSMDGNLVIGGGASAARVSGEVVVSEQSENPHDRARKPRLTRLKVLWALAAAMTLGVLVLAALPSSGSGARSSASRSEAVRPAGSSVISATGIAIPKAVDQGSADQRNVVVSNPISPPAAGLDGAAIRLNQPTSVGQTQSASSRVRRTVPIARQEPHAANPNRHVPASKSASCSPPYYLDAKGIRRLKTECM
jgi:eukaryotic-like serine/threonine-protein kinase